MTTKDSGFSLREDLRPEGGDISVGKMVWIGVGALAAIAVAANLKDLYRYIKIASM